MPELSAFWPMSGMAKLFGSYMDARLVNQAC